jgi:branched-chain amino acid transport system substrate-binding protein
MNRKPVGAAFAALVATTALHSPALAQNEQFIPNLVYRTGAYAPNGIPFANGLADYYTLINERDGGINGVKIVFEECDTGYATDRGVECYERLKRKGPTGAAYILPLSTGITFALTEKAPVDKIPIISMGYGRSESPTVRYSSGTSRCSAPIGQRPTSFSSLSLVRSAAGTR